VVETERFIVPAKPLTLVNVIVDLPDPAIGIVSDEGFAEMVKSPVELVDVTVTDTVVPCDRDPLEPVTWTE